MSKILEFLKGKKTYCVAIAAIAAAVAAYSSDAMTAKELVEAIVGAVLAMTIRAGVAKTQ